MVFRMKIDMSLQGPSLTCKRLALACVFSHAFIIPLEQMIKLIHLRPFLVRLAFQRPKKIDLAPLDIAVDHSPSQSSPALISAANTFGIRGSLPVVYLGSEGFENLVASLWATLCPEIRSGFAFRLSFSPQDLVESPRPALVCTPENLAHRWDSDRILDATDQNLSGGLAAAVLADHPLGPRHDSVRSRSRHSARHLS